MCGQISCGSPHHATRNACRTSLPPSSLFEPRRPSSVLTPSTKMENIEMVKVVAQTPIWNAWMVPLQVRRRKPCDDFSLHGEVHQTSEEMLRKAEHMNLNQHPFMVSDERALEHLNPMLGSSLIANTAHRKMADVELSLASEVHRSEHRTLPIKDRE